MKRLVTIIASLIIVSGAAFAGDFYNGDIQFQFGLGLDSTRIEDMDDDITAKEGVFGMQSWHLFKPASFIGLGFMGGFNIGVGPTEQLERNVGFGKVKGNTTGVSISTNFEFGPAIGIYLGDVVRFGANVGYTSGFNYDMPFNYEDKDNHKYYTSSIYADYIGFTTGIQAKFLPNKKCNPIIGWKLVKGYSNTITNKWMSSESRLESERELSYKYDFTQNIIYAGVGISW